MASCRLSCDSQQLCGGLREHRFDNARNDLARGGVQPVPPQWGQRSGETQQAQNHRRGFGHNVGIERDQTLKDRFLAMALAGQS